MFSVYLKYIKDCLRFIKQHLMIGECDLSFVYGNPKSSKLDFRVLRNPILNDKKEL